MTSIINKLAKPGSNCPDFLLSGLQYEVRCGSEAYGCNMGIESDIDIYGVTIPSKEIVFPHLSGELFGFDLNSKRFEQWLYSCEENKTKYDITCYNIVKYFRLCANCNPNMISSLFVPDNCIIYLSNIGKLIRENRKLFLSKKIMHTFQGYAYSQKSNILKCKKSTTSKRRESIEKFGYDVKYSYHLIRLLNEAEQILIEQDLDLQRSKEQLISIRKGEWKLEDILAYFDHKEKLLEEAYIKSNLPHFIREREIKQLLLNCLEEFYGTVSNTIKKEVDNNPLINDLKDLVKKYS